MDQWLVAACSLVVFFAFAAGWFIGHNERRGKGRYAVDDLEAARRLADQSIQETAEDLARRVL